MVAGLYSTTSLTPLPQWVLILGANPSGIAAASRAARMGLKVWLVEPSDHFGGMPTAGLNQTDREIIGDVFGRWGFLSEFEAGFGRLAGRATYLFPTPAAADQIFREKIAETGNVSLRMDAGDVELVVKDAKRRITSVRIGGIDYPADHYIDCTDEGDLAAAAGCMMRIGRDAALNTLEPTAGVRVPVKSTALAYDPETGQRLAGILPRPIEVFGEADHRHMAYNMRLIGTQDPRRTQWKDMVFPAGFKPNPEDYRADLNLAIAKNYRNAPFSDGTTPLLPLGEYELHDLNNGGGIVIGTNWIGQFQNWDTLTWAQRKAERDRYVLWIAGKFYVMATDPEWAAKRPDLVAALNTWGLVPGMFPNTIVPGFPPYIYVRQLRQLVAQTIYDIRTFWAPQRNSQAEPVSLVGYHQDGHWAILYADLDGTITVEGSNLAVDGQPVVGWQLPWGALKPHREAATNLLVARATGGTRNGHIGMRVELSYIKAGDVCGIAVGVAAALGIVTADIDYKTDLLPALRTAGAVLHFAEAA